MDKIAENELEGERASGRASVGTGGGGGKKGEAGGKVGR